VSHGEATSLTRSRLGSPWITTKEVDEAAADFIERSPRKECISRLSPRPPRFFRAIYCISLNDEVVHGIGSQRRIQYGEIVKLDIG